jgi:trk system potassium uptake protein TrkH
MNSEKHILKHKKFHIIHPLMYIILSFILVIFIGSILLVLPISSSGMSNSLSYIDSLFLSTSAVCVTGLSPIASIGESLSIFGKIVMCVLIQIGGLSLVTIVAFIIVTARKRLNRSTANVVKEQLNQSGYGELKILLKHIIIITIIFEVFGALINLIVFCQDYPFFEALGISFFHSVSSFNNAGFDILGSTSLAAYSDNILLNLNTCFLIVAGGLGFLVYENIFGIGKYKRLTIQTKVVLIMNAILIVSSFLIVKFLQWDSITWLQAFFYSINLRTAGFSSFDVGSVITGSTAIFSAAMMFIGGSPLSTAGGIKATTFFVIIMAIFALFTGKNPVIYKRELTRESIRKALILFVLAIFGISLAIFLICLIEGGKFTFVQVFYECFSAFGTVGLSMGITTQISIGSKIVLCLLMFFGRLGPVTILTMFSPFFKHKSDDIAYLETDISIG